MDTSEIIEQLQKLQIKQNELIAQLVSRNSKPVTKQEKSLENSIDDSEKLKIGDSITLLSSGVRSKKGDKATVTGTKGKTVHFVIARNGVSTHRLRHNVRKLK